MIGHLIGTPLNVIAGRAALTRASVSADAIDENLRRIEAQVERLAQRIRRLIEYLGVPETAVEPRSAKSITDEALALYGPVAEARNVQIQCSVDEVEGLNVDSQPALLVLTCLLSLATRTSSPGGVIRLAVAEYTARSVIFEVLLPGLSGPLNRIDRLDPPDQGTVDSDVTQVLSICLGIARRGGGGIEIVRSDEIAQRDATEGLLVRFECARL
jgi:signal transduction histidine kinase